MIDVIILMILVSIFGRPRDGGRRSGRGAEVEADHHGDDRHRLFALLFERAGLLPALVVLVLIASLGGEEFKLTEVIGNIVVLSILCTSSSRSGSG